MKRMVLLIISLLLLGSCDYEKPILITPDYVSVDYKEQMITFYTNDPIGWLQVWHCEYDYHIEDQVYIVEGEWFRLEGHRDSNRVDLFLDENDGEKRYLYFMAHKLVSADIAVVIQGSHNQEDH